MRLSLGTFAATKGKEAFPCHGSCQVDGTAGGHSCFPLEDKANKEERAKRWRKYAVQTSINPWIQPYLNLTALLDKPDYMSQYFSFFLKPSCGLGFCHRKGPNKAIFFVSLKKKSALRYTLSVIKFTHFKYQFMFFSNMCIPL